MPMHTSLVMPFSPSFALAISPSDILDFHRARFGDARMEDPPADDGSDGDDESDPKDAGGADTLGDAGKKALDAERDARKKADAAAKAATDQMTTLLGAMKSALGIGDTGGGGEDDTTASLAAIQTELDALKREKLISEVATDHRITDKADIALLRSAKDEEALTALAKRLAPKPDEATSRRGGSPRPDPSQGAGGGSGRPGSVAEVIAERRAAREGKSK